MKDGIGEDSNEKISFFCKTDIHSINYQHPWPFNQNTLVGLFELLLSYIKKSELDRNGEIEISFTPEELKERLDAQKYNKFYDFRRFILEKARDEINTCSEDINVSFDYFYKGKIATMVNFRKLTRERHKHIVKQNKQRKV